MAKLTIKLDKRTMNKQGEYPIRFLLTHGKSSSTFITTGVSIQEKYWNDSNDVTRVVKSSCPNAKAINLNLAQVYMEMVNRISKMTLDSSIDRYTITELKEILLRKDEVTEKMSFTRYFNEYIARVKTNTKKLYEWTQQQIELFSHGKTLYFEDISYRFLCEFDNWMQNNGNKMNTRSIHMRNIRKVFNDAIDNDVCAISLYPFRKFKIKNAQKEKVYLKEDKFKELLNLDIPDTSVGTHRARDLMLISFLLCGANAIDIFKMKKPVDGIITFVRTKIEHCEPLPIHIAVTPELQEIIDRNKGEGEYLFNFEQKYIDYDSFYSMAKKRIKWIANEIGVPDMSFYYMRYSWATYASKIGVDESVIGKALGHTDVSLAGSRYISFDWSRVDDANRRVIEYLYETTK